MGCSYFMMSRGLVGQCRLIPISDAAVESRGTLEQFIAAKGE